MLPDVLASLPSAAEIFDRISSCADIPRNLDVRGALVAEIFCGAAAITLSMVMLSVPCICPWDVKYGEQFNVLKHGIIFQELIRYEYVACMHFATPCTSMTWARWPQLRSASEPQGVSHASEKQKQLLHLGNALLAFSLECSLMLLAAGGYFSLENPELSWLWLQEGTLTLLSKSGVALVRVLFKDFAAPFYKPTLFMHNIPTLHGLRDISEAYDGPLVPLRGLMVWEGKLQFRTHVAQAYPPKLAEHYAVLVNQALDMRSEAMERGQPIPLAVKEAGDGLSPSLRHAARLLPEPSVSVECVAEQLVPYGLVAVKGLVPLDHVQWAEGVEHPSANPPPGRFESSS